MPATSMVPAVSDSTTTPRPPIGPLARARHDPRLEDLKAAGWDGERLICRTAWANARGLRLPRDAGEQLDAHDEEAITTLHTFMDGLTLQAISYPERINATIASQRVQDALTSLLSEAKRTVRAVRTSEQAVFE